MFLFEKKIFFFQHFPTLCHKISEIRRFIAVVLSKRQNACPGERFEEKQFSWKININFLIHFWTVGEKSIFGEKISAILPIFFSMFLEKKIDEIIYLFQEVISFYHFRTSGMFLKHCGKNHQHDCQNCSSNV